MEARCFATLLYRGSADGNYTEQERMVSLWANRMLHFTALPVYVMFAGPVNATQILQHADPFGRLRLLPVTLLDFATRSTLPRYRHLWTKLHAWRLPCQRVALLDYDGWAVAAPDGIFDACDSSAELCASHAYDVGRNAEMAFARAAGAQRPDYFNAGVLVLQPSNRTFERLLSRARLDQQANAHRKEGDQDFFNVAFPEWKELNRSFNIMGGLWRREGQHAWASSGRAHFIHERIARHPPAFAQRLWCAPRRSPTCRRGRNVFGCCRDPNDDVIK